ncbi:MAG: HAMP domain-containing histidine kinase, partial [Calditrichaeota bacterium]|nr:HAMP domain-containing histidine kinase [Calditrichota bacterium]
MKSILSKYKIHVIITLMTLASVGLIVLQFYWIDSAYVIQKQSFKENVNNVLTLLSEELEKKEVLNYIESNKGIIVMDTLHFPYSDAFANVARNSSRFEFKVDDQTEHFFSDESAHYNIDFDNTIQTMNVVRTRAGSKSKQSTVDKFFKYDYKDNRLTLQVRALKDDSIIADSTFVFGKVDERSMTNVRKRINSFSSGRRKSGVVVSEEYEVSQKSSLEGQKELLEAQKHLIEEDADRRRLLRLNSAPNGYIFGFKTESAGIHDRVNLPQIDSLLKSMFNDRNIDLNYKLSVYNSRSNPFLLERNLSSLNKDHSVDWMQKRIKREEKSSDDTYRVQLFPRDLVSANAFLSIEFNDQDFFIYRQILVPVLISILLIAIIIYCFAISVLTIFRQKKLSELKNDFINNMTHELKTPISTISLATEGILKADITKKPEKLIQYGKIIYDENKRLGSHVERILKLSVMESGDIDLKIEDVSVNELIAEVAQIVRLQIEEKSGELHCHTDAEYDLIQADYEHLKNVLINLLDNAVKYSVNQPLITIRSWNEG